MSAEEVAIRVAERADVAAVLALWASGRSEHASLADKPEAAERGNMYRLAVDSAQRRRGVARALVREGERRLRERGTARVTALVAHDDPVARGFWTAAGYGNDREIGRFVRNV